MRADLMLVAAALACAPVDLGAAQADTALVPRLMKAAMRDHGAYELLRRLITAAPHRLSGSAGAEEAIAFVHRELTAAGFERVAVESLLVPRWERGPVEEAVLLLPGAGQSVPLAVCALGGSVGTPSDGVEGHVVIVRSFEELRMLGDTVRGSIVLFNRPMDPALVNPFDAYGGAVNQRSRGAIEAARAGAVAALVRSVTSSHDNVPHTGAMHYAAGVPQIPAAAISTVGADLLEQTARTGARVRLRLSCRTLPDVMSGNVMGQITGSEFPDDVVLVGGHLDAWDKGSGAHDDGAGCAQAIEVLHILRKAGLKPKRTVRAVLFMNEENGNRGGAAYQSAPAREGERHVAALESDRGGSSPRGFFVEADSAILTAVQRWRPLFEELGAGDFQMGGSGVDIAALVKAGVPGFGLAVDHHRYFDYHHSDNDTIDRVHPRELELGAVAEALLCYLIAQHGLPAAEKEPSRRYSE